MITTNIDGKALISNSAIASECRTFRAKLRFGNVDYDELYSFTYTSYISPQKCTLGSTPSAMFKCEISGLSSSASALKNQVFKALITILDLNDNICLGEFKITDATVKDGIYSITAYDKMNFVRDKPYMPTIKGQQLIFNVFKDICTQIDNESITDGFTKISPVSFTDTAKIDPSVLSGYPLKDALSYLCAYAGRNCLVNRNGAFEARKYTVYTTYQLLDDDRIEMPELDEFDSEIQSLTALINDEDVLSAGMSSAQGLTFVCPIMTQSRLNDLYSKDFGLTSNAIHLFRAGKVNQILGDPRLEVGDVVTLTHEGKKYNIPIMSLKIDYDGGLMSEIETFGFGDDSGVSLAQKIDFSIKKSKQVSKYAQASSDLSGVIAGGLGLYRTEQTDESGAIRTYMHDKPQLENSSYIATFNSKGFAWTVNGWNNGSPVWSDGVDTTASNMVMKTIYAHKITADLIDVSELSALNATIGGWKILSTRLENNSIASGGYRSGIQCLNTPSSAAFYAGCSSETSIADPDITNFYVTQSGALYAQEGNIAGFCIAGNHTASNGFWNNSISSIVKSADSTYPEYAVFMRGQNKDGTSGACEPTHAVFGVKVRPDNVTTWNEANYTYRVRADGHLFASAADITGKITASEGAIGNWKIGNAPQLGRTALHSTAGSYEVGMHASSTAAHLAFYVKHSTDGDMFYVKHNGEFYAKKADIEGKITATSGKIGGWKINSTYIVSEESNYRVALCNFDNNNDNSRVLYCQKKSDESYTFRLYRDGTLLATNVDIKGKITATSGSFTGSRKEDNSAVSIRNGNIYLEYYSQLCIVKPQNEGTNIVLRYEPPPNNGTSNYGVLFGIDTSPLHLYGTSVWANGSIVSGSDERIKCDICQFDKNYEEMFESLCPVTFKYINGTSGRKHFGFIAQQVLESAISAGLTSNDIAAYVSSNINSDNPENYTLGLRYSEFISLNTHMIQKCLKEIAALKAEISLLKSERI